MGEETNLAEDSNSILFSVKKLIGVPKEEKSFDLDIMLHINGAVSILYQLGVVDKAFVVDSETDTYTDFFPGVSDAVLSLVKLYFVYKVRLGFDSSTLSGSMVETLKELIRESEYRLLVEFNAASQETE